MPLFSPVDLADPVWAFKFSVSYVSQLVDAQKQVYAPIPEAVIGVTFDSPIIAVTVATTDETNRTKFGYIRQIKSIGTGQNAVTGARSIWRGTQVVKFDDDDPQSYVLTFKPAHRVRQVSIVFYQFD